MKTTARKGATKSAIAFTSKVAPKPATKPRKNSEAIRNQGIAPG